MTHRRAAVATLGRSAMLTRGIALSGDGLRAMGCSASGPNRLSTCPAPPLLQPFRREARVVMQVGCARAELAMVVCAALLLCGCGDTAQAGPHSTPGPAAKTARDNSAPKQKPAPRPGPEGAHEARRFLIGDGVARDRAKAYELFTRDCEQRDRASCVALVQASRVSSEARSKALKMLVQLCTAGDEKSCRAPIPGLLINGDKAWLNDACARGYAVACTKADDPVKGCSKGDPDGCFAAAQQQPKQAQKWKDAGVEILRRTCREGVGHDCATLADVYRAKPGNDDGSTKELDARANDLLLGDCRAADLSACNRLSAPRSTTKPTTAQLEAHLMECYLMPASCRSLVERYRQFKLRDLAAMRIAYEVSCFEGPARRQADDCVAGAKLWLEDDAAARKDRKRAEAMMGRACDLGSSEGCTFRR